MSKEEKKTTAIIILSTLLFINIVLIIIGKSVIDDLVLTANGYKSDKNVCNIQKQEVIEECKELEEHLNEAN